MVTSTEIAPLLEKSFFSEEQKNLILHKARGGKDSTFIKKHGWDPNRNPLQALKHGIMDKLQKSYALEKMRKESKVYEVRDGEIVLGD